MAQSTLTLNVRIRWWLRWYLYGVTVFCTAFNCSPNTKRVDAWVKRGVYFELP